MIKVKEKFDKCNKEKLLEFSDLLDVPVGNANTRKVCWFKPCWHICCCGSLAVLIIVVFMLYTLDAT